MDTPNTPTESCSLELVKRMDLGNEIAPYIARYEQMQKQVDSGQILCPEDQDLYDKMREIFLQKSEDISAVQQQSQEVLKELQASLKNIESVFHSALLAQKTRNMEKVC